MLLRKGRNLFWILIGIALLIMSIVMLYQPTLILIYRQDPDATAHAFWRSMQKNDLSTAHKIVSAENLALVESWMSNHVVSDVPCSDFFYEGPTSSGRYLSTTEWQSSVYLTCTARSGNHYCFAVYDIIVEKSTKGWLVTEWGLINEGESIAECRVDRLP